MSLSFSSSRAIGIGAVVEKRSVGGIQVRDREPLIFVPQAGMLARDRVIAQDDVGVRRRSNDVRPFANAEVFALLLACQSHEPPHHRRLFACRPPERSCGRGGEPPAAPRGAYPIPGAFSPSRPEGPADIRSSGSTGKPPRCLPSDVRSRKTLPSCALLLGAETGHRHGPFNAKDISCRYAVPMSSASKPIPWVTPRGHTNPLLSNT